MPTQCTRSKPPIQLEFPRVGRRRLVASFDGGTITSNAGALLLRAVEKCTGVCRRAAECFQDYRDPSVIEHTVEDLVTQRVMAVALGYEDLNDHDTLRRDPLVAAAVGKADPTGENRVRPADRGAALAGKSTLNRLELVGSKDAEADRYKKVTYDEAALDALLVDVFIESHPTPPARIVLDVDATDDPLHGQQEGRFFHGYYRHYCYLPLYIFCGAQVLCARLRPSNLDGAAGVVDELARICGAGAAGVAVGLHPGSGRLGVLPRRAAELVRRACGGLRHRLGEERSVEGTHRARTGAGPGTVPGNRDRRAGVCGLPLSHARRAGAGSAGWSARPSICPRAPIHGSW